MKRLVATAVVVAATFGWLAALFAVQPFDRANAALDRAFGALPAWTQVANMFRDAATQELSRGEHPLASFGILRQAWAAHPDAARFVLMGNSQTLMTSLAPGEAPPSEPEKTYTDHIADQFRSAGSRQVFYRLSAGALSYQEMLWYTAYLALKPEIRPNVLLVQLNYQNFSNGGIRAGMHEMLSDGAFRAAIEELARGGRPDAAAFAEAVREYEAAHRTAGPSAHGAESGNQSGNQSGNLGFRLETRFRGMLEKIPGFDRRDELKRTFAYMLTRCRVYLLRISPASRRSLGGVRVAASRAAVEDLLELGKRSGIRVVLFQAPTNPAVPLYRTEEDDRGYHEFARAAASRFGVPVLDFEHSIPASAWGKDLNLPDPLHLGREGHRALAGLVLSGLAGSGI